MTPQRPQPDYSDEMQTKLSRLRHYLSRNGLEGAMLWSRANFAWITCGHDNHIVGASPIGEAAIIVTPDQIVCFCNVIESPRMQQEELRGTGIETIDTPWHDRDETSRRFREIVGRAHVACDFDKLQLGLPELPGDFASLRQTLVEQEIVRYRTGGARAAEAMELACRAIQPGMTEQEIAGRLEYEIRKRGMKPHVTLVACDERVHRFRHPIPTGNALRNYAMLVTCADYCGLIANLTRLVHFSPPPSALIEQHQKVCDVDAIAIRATRPGRTLGTVFEEIQRAYELAGFSGEWTKHHQGGLSGYATREIVATPGSNIPILAGQAFAWNPSLPGVKSEDTILVTASGVEVLTRCSDEWPSVESGDGSLPMRRPGILVR